MGSFLGGAVFAAVLCLALFIVVRSILASITGRKKKEIGPGAGGRGSGCEIKGLVFGIKCGSCGCTNKPSARFCGGCGKQLTCGGADSTS